jgi:Fe-S-cluster containining protein
MVNKFEFEIIKKKMGEFKTIQFGTIHYIEPPCIFFSNDQCMIYGIRPLACRKYPIIINFHEENNGYVDYYLSSACSEVENITQIDVDDMLDSQLKLIAFQKKFNKQRKLKIVNKERVFMSKFIRSRKKVEKELVLKPYSSLSLQIINLRINYYIENRIFTYSKN